MCLDIDNIDDVDLAKTQINNIGGLKPFLLFTSPRGNGIKAIYKVEGVKADQVAEAYEYVADLVENAISVTVDRAPKSVASACFLSWDREAILNKDAHVRFLSLLSESTKDKKRLFFALF